MAGVGGPDGLHTPLGQGPVAPATAAAAKAPYLIFALGGCALLGFGLVAVLGLPKNHFAGEPVATAQIEVQQRPPAALAPATAPGGGEAAGVIADETASIDKGRRQLSVAEVEARSGVKITRQGGEASGALIIQLDQAAGVHLNAAPDKRLVEKSAFGLLPKIAVDGQRPLEVYARPVLTAARIRPGAPRIALVMGGLGLNAGDTSDAIARLPGAVTLGFAPYGEGLDKQVARAREDGHEVILQLPMEPFDYPANDPGPHTLTLAAAPAQQLDNLRWHLGRFTGYVGVSNFLGGKFMADTAAFNAVLREVQLRGLLFLDDGTSARSLTMPLSAALGLQAVAADVALDADARPEAIDAALTRLETLARANGSATGSAQALPTSVEKIARFAKALEGRGIALVPVSALAGRLRAVAEWPKIQ